jgi:transposase
MNKLGAEERTAVIAALVEGNSLRAVTRITGVHRTTVMKLLCDLGRGCSQYQDKVFRNLKCRRIQCDEIWSFVYAKDRNCPAEHKAKENLEHAVGLHYMHYNFCRIHQTLRVTPSMEAGISDHVWSLDEVITLLV